MKLVHWSLMGGRGLLHLVHQGGDWAEPQPTQVSPRCTKCNSPPINGQCTNPLLCGFDVSIKGFSGGSGVFIGEGHWGGDTFIWGTHN